MHLILKIGSLNSKQEFKIFFNLKHIGYLSGNKIIIHQNYHALFQHVAKHMIKNR